MSGHLIHDGPTQTCREKFFVGISRISDSPERLTNIPDNAACQNVMFVDLRRRCINMDDGTGFIFVPKIGVIFHDIVANADNEIGAVKATLHIVVCLQTDSPQGELV